MSSSPSNAVSWHISGSGAIPSDVPIGTLAKLQLAMGPVWIRCGDCNSRNVRRSTVRVADIMPLLLLRYPIRCRSCRARTYVGILRALKLERSPRRR